LFNNKLMQRFKQKVKLSDADIALKPENYEALHEPSVLYPI